jgi:hypothetical protein
MTHSTLFPRIPSASLAVSALLCLAEPSTAQGWTNPGSTDIGVAGRYVAIVTDQNGDGRDDVVNAGLFATILSGLDGHYVGGIAYGDNCAGVLFSPFNPGWISGDTTYTTSGVPVGRVSWIYGPSRGYLVGTSYSGFGASLDAIGEINGTPGEEYVIGAPGDFGSNGGFAVVYSGTSSVIRHDGQQTNEGFGQAVCGLDDLDGDGFNEYAIGSPRFNKGSPFSIIDAGKVTIYSGQSHSVLQEINGSGSYTFFGSAIADVEDIDQDGVSDFIVGGPGYGSDLGGAWVYSGATQTFLFSILGDFPSEKLGKSVAGIGDVNDDGIPDVAVGAPYNSDLAAHAGRALVYSGTGQHLRTKYGALTGGLLGWSIGGGGDCNGDGIDDIVYGSPGPSGAYDGQIDLEFSCPATATSYGTGWPGTNGVPHLDMIGDPIHDEDIVLDIGNSSGSGSVVLLFLGLSPGNFATSKGGTLFLAPSQTWVVPLPIGGLQMPATIPGGPAGAQCLPTAYLQALQQDHGASHGLSFTPGLQLRFGNLPVR